jgi:hypothetical protein
MSSDFQGNDDADARSLYGVGWCLPVPEIDKRNDMAVGMGGCPSV